MKKISVILLVAGACTLQFCSSSKKTASVKPPPPMNYVTNVQPAILAYCSPCHIPPKGFKKALDSYDAVKSNIDDIIMRIRLNPGDRGFMPFKHAKLSDSAINVFVKWQAEGMLEK